MDESRLAVEEVESHVRYRHNPLRSPRHFRLLRITPDEDPEATISITLEEFNIDDAPAYKALSYTWGKAILDRDTDKGNPATDDADTVEGFSPRLFEVNEKGYIQAMQNLHDVLRRLRNHENGFLWADALCIDQTNVDERQLQVLLMGQLYSGAEQVIVWLGETDEDSDSVLYLLEHWCPLAGDAAEQRREINLVTLNTLGLSVAEWGRHWEDCRRFFERRAWFHRAWVVQEYVLATGITIRCGPHIIVVDDLVLVAKKANSTSYEIGLNTYDFVLLHLMRGEPANGAGSADDETRLVFGAKTSVECWYSNLLGLIDLIRSHQATLRHDKVYSLLGIADRISPTPNNFRLDLDYSMPAEDLFLQFGSLTITNVPFCVQMSLVEQMELRHRQTLPSWCPDFSILRGRVPKPIIYLNAAPDGTTDDGTLHLNALSSLLYESQLLSVDGQTLTLSGKQVGRVSKRTDHSGDLAKSLEMYRDDQAPFQLFDICLEVDEPYVLTQQSRLEVLAQTLGAGTGCYHLQEHLPMYPQPDRILQAFRARYIAGCVGYIKDLRSDTQKIQKFLRDVQSWHERFSNPAFNLPTAAEVEKTVTTVNDSLDSGDLQDFAEVFDAGNEFSVSNGYFLGRVLLLTEQNWLGLGPTATEPGDELWLLKATPIPFVLRPTADGKYTVVGEAYVHGIMHGELVDAPGGKEGFGEVHLI